ncbi:hypothetical protein [Fusobacterium varium]|uniref:hypothetical protein n=1 Tax=Fusobacterium varium TaxID=856 RepID=UPI00242A4591|nr:hypothetical protein [Fusobacterium varium]MCI6031552.1 hypothetical protein [Fusobacterium varium]MDY4005203.1 hypothetical protein [Fusobacterium varium]
MEKARLLSVPEAAKILGQGQEKIRRSLIQGKAPFGYAVKMENEWNYVISEYQLFKYFGIKKAPEEPASSTSAK